MKPRVSKSRSTDAWWVHFQVSTRRGAFRQSRPFFTWAEALTFALSEAKGKR